MWAGMESKTYFFIGTSISLVIHALFSRIFKYKVVLYQIEGTSDKLINFFQKLEQGGYLSIINRNDCINPNSHTLTISITNKIVKQFKSSNKYKALNAFVKNDEVELILKRVISSNLFHFVSLVKYIKQNRINNSLVFLKKNYSNIYSSYLKEIDQEVKYRFFGLKFNIAVKAKFYSALLFCIIHIVSQKISNKKITADPKNFKYAISVPHKWAAKFDGPREFTFLVDNHILKKEDAVFLIEYPENSSFYKKFSKKGFCLLNASNGFRLAKIFKPNCLISMQDFRNIFRLILLAKKENYLYETLTNFLLQKFIWGSILSEINFKNYIYFNKESKSQISLNILLKSQKIKSHCYCQFIGGPYQLTSEKSPFDKRNIYWAYLNPDFFYVNNKAMKDSFSHHSHMNVKYKVIGNIFSEKIIDIRNNKNMLERLVAKFSAKGFEKIIGIFDTSYTDSKEFYSNFEEAISFLEDIINLSKSNPDSLFLLKPSKPDNFFLEGFWSGKNGYEIVALRSKFNKLSNAFILSDSSDVVELISISDVVFTHCFSSPTADAILANIPSFWYQSRNDVSYSPYNEIPGLVIFGLDNLHSMMHDIKNKNFNLDYSNQQLIELVGDSKKSALSDLRKELTCEKF